MPKSIWDTRSSTPKAVTFDEALKMSGWGQDADEDGDDWITINGAHVLVGANGEVKSGAGGKFTGTDYKEAREWAQTRKSIIEAQKSGEWKYGKSVENLARTKAFHDMFPIFYQHDNWRMQFDHPKYVFGDELDQRIDKLKELCDQLQEEGGHPAALKEAQEAFKGVLNERNKFEERYPEAKKEREAREKAEAEARLKQEEAGQHQDPDVARRAEKLQKKEAEYKKRTDRDLAQISNLNDARNGNNDTRTWEKMNEIAKDVFERTEKLEAEKLATEGKTTVKKELAEREQIRNTERENYENSSEQLNKCMGVGWSLYGVSNPRDEIDSKKSLVDYIENHFNYKLSSKEVSELLADAGKGKERYYNAYKNFKEYAADCWRDSLAIVKNGHCKFDDDHLPLDIYESRNFEEKFEKKYADKNLNKIFTRREKKGLPEVYSDPTTPDNYMKAISRNNIYKNDYHVPYDVDRNERY